MITTTIFDDHVCVGDMEREFRHMWTRMVIKYCIDVIWMRMVGTGYFKGETRRVWTRHTSNLHLADTSMILIGTHVDDALLIYDDKSKWMRRLHEFQLVSLMCQKRKVTQKSLSMKYAGNHVPAFYLATQLLFERALRLVKRKVTLNCVYLQG